MRCGVDSPPLTALCGTAGYVAPEMIRASEGGAPYGVAVDLFALGGVLFALLGNCPAFDPRGELTDDEILDNVKRGQWSFDVRGPWGRVSDAARQLITALLEPDPAKRPTAREVMQCPWACGEGASDATVPAAEIGGLPTLERAQLRGGRSFSRVPFEWTAHGRGREIDLCWGAGCGMYM